MSDPGQNTPPRTLQYENIDLHFVSFSEGTVHGYRVLVSSPAGQTSAPFAVPAMPEGAAAGEKLREAVRKRVGLPAAQAAGQSLFDALFTGEVRDVFRESQDRAAAAGAGLRVRLHFRDAPDLSDLPWELLYSSVQQRFLALSAETPIVRYLDQPGAPRALSVRPPLRMLVMIARPSDLEQLDVEAEWTRLTGALAAPMKSGTLTIERAPSATVTTLARFLREGEFHILHFIGHGDFDEAAQDGTIALEGDDGRAKALGAKELGALLHDHRSLRLVVLNACEGARSAQGDAFAGTAQSLIRQGVPAVIGMQRPVSDRGAIVLAQELYGALSEGYPIDAALTETRRVLQAEAPGAEWATPVLYMRSPDGQLFDLAAASAPPWWRQRAVLAGAAAAAAALAAVAVYALSTTAPSSVQPEATDAGADASANANAANADAEADAAAQPAWRHRGAGCLEGYFRDISAQRVVSLEVGTQTYRLMGINAAFQAPLGVYLTEFGQPVMGIRMLPLKRSDVFKIASVVDSQCKEIDTYENASRGGDKQTIVSWDVLAVSTGGHRYELRLGFGDDGGKPYLEMSVVRAK